MPGLTIDGLAVTAAEGETILRAAERAGIDIPHFCYHAAFPPEGNCRMCVVDMWQQGWDEDWFKMTLGAGDTLTVETYSAGGAWECDTAIDIADDENYIRTANDKSEFDLYSRLTYRNETGEDRLYYFQVKPYPKYLAGINRFADYIVEFRR